MAEEHKKPILSNAELIKGGKRRLARKNNSNRRTKKECSKRNEREY